MRMLSGGIEWKSWITLHLCPMMLMCRSFTYYLPQTNVPHQRRVLGDDRNFNLRRQAAHASISLLYFLAVFPCVKVPDHLPVGREWPGLCKMINRPSSDSHIIYVLRHIWEGNKVCLRWRWCWFRSCLVVVIIMLTYDTQIDWTEKNCLLALSRKYWNDKFLFNIIYVFAMWWNQTKPLNSNSKTFIVMLWMPP